MHAAPDAPNTLIDSRAPQTPSVKVISAKRGIGLLSMSTLGMWQQSGFLADVFECFKTYGFSVDLSEHLRNQRNCLNRSG